jgi:predicted dehydrogenase
VGSAGVRRDGSDHARDRRQGIAMPSFDLSTGPDLPPKTDYRIGCIGAGFIMRDIHLVAYAEAGFDVVAIASRTPAHAREVAEARGIGTVHDTWQELLDDERVEIVDIAFPPDQQLGIVREAVKRPHVKGILAQKPVAFTLEEAIEMVRICDEAGKKLGVNHNMRYDQSIRALKTLLDRGELGEPVVAEIVMNARPHWQEFIKPYGRIALLNMSIHHLDAMRYLFGDPERILVSVRTDPSHDFPHEDGMAFYILEYESGLRAIGLDNCYTWADHGIQWRVEGTEGIAKGTIGWPDYPNGSPSTIDWTLRSMEGEWERPRWEERWFPQAFKGTMGQLMRAIADDAEPAISGHTTVGTMALVEAAYLSVREHRAVSFKEIEYQLVGP